MSSSSSDEQMIDRADEDYDTREHIKRQGRRRIAELRARQPRANQDEETRERNRSQDRQRKATQRARHPIADADAATVQRIHEQGQERSTTYRMRHPIPGEAEHLQALQRQHRYLVSHQEQDVHDEPITLALLEPVTTAHSLGPLDNECPYCGALHFVGAHVCCQGGHVFIPPFNRMPQPLFSLLFNEHARNKSNFFGNIIGYNSLFSFASIQYHHIRPEKYGVQVAKAKGVIRHFASTVLPNDPNSPQYGNFYVYQGSEAVQKRMENPIFEDKNRDIMQQLEQCLRDHPLARSYRTMDERMKEEERNHRNPQMMRMKIVDKYEYEHKLKGHKGIYDSPTNTDYISVFFSCDIDQKTLPRGLIIYPKLNNSNGTQVFYWSKIVNTMCYPIIFPRGENGWSSRTTPRVQPESFNQRLRRFIAEKAVEGVDINAQWDSDDEPPPEPPRHRPRIQIATTESDPNLEMEAEESEDDYDKHYDQSMTIVGHNENIDNHGIRFIERGGEVYPRRRTQRKGSTEQVDESDSGEDEDMMEGMEDAPEDIGQQSITVLQPRSNEYGYNEESGEENDEDEQMIAEPAGLVNIQENMDASVEHHDIEDMTVHEEESDHRRKFISMREWALYQCQRRKRFRNRITATRKLGQVFVIDMFTRILQSRMRAIEEHCTQYLSTTRSKFLEAFQRIATRYNRTIGAVTTIPSYVPGSPRYMRKKYEEAITMANKFGHPDIFLTFTAAADWEEIKNNIPPGHTWADHPFLVCEVFKKKYEALLDDVIGKRIQPRGSLRQPGIFGAVKWYVYSIEFQQRGAPHMHLIISLVNHISTVVQIDAVCQAVIPKLPNKNDPSYHAKKKLRDMVVKYMIHRPCENDNEAYCHNGQKQHWTQCLKHFPKDFMDQTEFGDRTYPALKRPNDGEYCTKEIKRDIKKKDDVRGKKVVRGKKQQVRIIVRADNRHVVPYNSYLLTKYQSHMNVEIISSIAVIKYLFKYLFKGFDRSLVECIQNIGMEGNSSYGVSGEMTMAGNIMRPKNMKFPRGVIEKRCEEARKRLALNGVNLRDAAGNPTLVYNECADIEDMRATTSCEAAWNIAGYHLNGFSHSVVTVFVHCPDEEPIHYHPGEAEATERIAREGNIMTMLKAWFALNDSQGEDAELARTLTFDEVCLQFRFEKGKWIRRKRDWSQHLVGRVKSINPRFMELFAIRLLCMNRRGIRSFDDLKTVNNQLHENFVDAAKALRLMNNEMEWQMALSEASTMATPTVLRRMFVSILLFCAPANPRELWEMQKDNFFEDRNWTIERKEAHALAHIQSALKSHNMSLRDYNLPAIDARNLPPINELIDDSKENINVNEVECIGNNLYQKLTDEQRNVVDIIIASIDNFEKKSFFIEGTGGSGKTFIYKCLYFMLSAQDRKVVCVAHTGVAASLLVNGSTVHSKFLIPLEVEENMKSQWNIEEADELQNTDVIIWDEACMTDRRIFDAVNTLFVYLHPERAGMLFGGIPFIMGGDWRQTLPIVEGVHDKGVIDYTLLRSRMWNQINLLRLHTNMRARGDPDYCAWIKQVGEGANFIDNKGYDILLREDILVDSEKELINFLYGNMASSEIDQSALLTVDNRTSLELNEKILKLLPVEEKELLARDECDKDKGYPALEPETYNALTPAGMPPFKLHLKVGAIVILLRNKSVFLGLVNGTRMRVTKIGNDVVFCKPIGGGHKTPPEVAIHRIPMTPAQAPSKELAFIRWQFPLRLAYAMTINKAQGQTLDKVGVLFRTVPFTHGQLYVALSRVRNAASIRVCNKTRSDDKRKIRNVVYDEVLHF